MSDAVLLMAHGSPASPDDVEPFLRRILRRHPPSPALVGQVRARYEAIGGVSPLPAITARQARALEKVLGMPVHVGMRFAAPFIADAVAQAAREGAKRLVGLALAPQYADVSVGAYHEAMRAALPAGVEPRPVRSWHAEEAFLRAWADRIPPGGPILFTAHSIPTEGASPYPEQLLETIRGISRLRRLPDWELAYQSRSPDPRPWLEPDVPAVLKRLAARGVREAVFAPIGFVSDHVEVLYDLDILHAGEAEALGIRTERVPSLNDDPGLIEALASAARKALAA